MIILTVFVYELQKIKRKPINYYNEKNEYTSKINENLFYNLGT